MRRVAAYALIIGEAAGLNSSACRTVERVALFHDIGKIHEALFDIIHDQTTLSVADRRAIATHPERGAKVLEPLGAPATRVDEARGSGGVISTGGLPPPPPPRRYGIAS